MDEDKTKNEITENFEEMADRNGIEPQIVYFGSEPTELSQSEPLEQPSVSYAEVPPSVGTVGQNNVNHMTAPGKIAGAKKKKITMAICVGVAVLFITILITIMTSGGENLPAGNNGAGGNTGANNPSGTSPDANDKIKIVIDLDQDLNIDEFYGYNSDGIAMVRSGKKYGFIGEDYKFVIPLVYDNIRWITSDDYINVQMNGKWGIADKSGKLVVPCTYDDVDSISIFGDFFIIKNGKKFGCISRIDGSIIVKFEYDKIVGLKENTFLLVKDGATGVYEIEG